MLPISHKWKTKPDLSWPWKRNVSPSATMRCENQLQLVNHSSLILTLKKTYQTLWPKWHALVNAANLLVASFTTSIMTILSNEARPASYDQLILMGLTKSTHIYCTYLLTSCISAERKECTKDTFCEHVTRILHAEWVVLCVLRVPRCHACMLEMHTKITVPDLQQLLLALDL